jgi:hypothetical protein
LLGGGARAHHARGLCAAHYARWLRHGDIRPDVPLRRREVHLCGCARPTPSGPRALRCGNDGCGLPILAEMLRLDAETHAEGLDGRPALALVVWL